MDLLACFLFNIHTPYLGFFIIILPCKDDVRLHPTHDADPSSVNFVLLQSQRIPPLSTDSHLSPFYGPNKLDGFFKQNEHHIEAQPCHHCFVFRNRRELRLNLTPSRLACTETFSIKDFKFLPQLHQTSYFS